MKFVDLPPSSSVSLRRLSGRLLYVGKNNESLVTLSDKKGMYHMLTERLQEKAAVDGTCAEINKQMLGQGVLKVSRNVGRVEMRWSEWDRWWMKLAVHKPLQEVPLLNLFSDRKFL
jgi:hypothetical protein